MKILRYFLRFALLLLILYVVFYVGGAFKEALTSV